MSDFNRALKILLEQEGGYSDHPADKGGKTMYGITERVAREHGYHGPMVALPLATASMIYHAEYWQAVKAEDMPWPLSMYVFDCAVNQGPGVAVRLLQAALDTIQDGVFGPTTKRLAADSTPWHAARFMAMRANRYVNSGQYMTFGTGWMTRLFEVAEKANR